MTEKLLTFKEVQTILRVSKSKLYRLIQQETIPAIRVGNTYRIPQEELEHYLTNSNTTERHQEVTV